MSDVKIIIKVREPTSGLAVKPYEHPLVHVDYADAQETDIEITVAFTKRIELMTKHDLRNYKLWVEAVPAALRGEQWHPSLISMVLFTAKKIAEGVQDRLDLAGPVSDDLHDYP